MRTLSRYFAARYLGLLAAILIGSTLIVSALEILLNFDEMLAGEGRAGILHYLVLRLPFYYLPQLIPLSAFGAAFLSLGLAARWREISALQASGIASRQVVLGILAASILLSLLTLVVQETWSTRAARSWNERERAGDEQLLFAEGAFWYHRGRRLYKIASADPKTRTLWGVEIFERDAMGHLLHQIECERVDVDEDGNWQLAHALSRRFDPARPDQPPRVALDTRLELHVSEDRDLLLHRDEASGLSAIELRQYIDSHRRTDRPGTRAHIARLRALLHHRLSEPALVWLFTLLAIPAALRVEAGGNLAAPALVGAGVISLFTLLRSLGSSLAGEAILPPLVAPWGILFFFGALGCGALWSHDR